ncbi:MAG: XdhC family protein, partial [Gammaproteobacteria bacterium]|nr:XdhC family protein [Gammaproteobacteria bacterium]
MQASIVIKAREGLEAGRTAHRIDNWFFEDIVGTDLNIAVFGAGHVGSAIVQALSGLDCNIRWIDSRRNIFRSTPANVRAIESREPALEVAAMPPQSCYLVMTHSHAIDSTSAAGFCGAMMSLTVV